MENKTKIDKAKRILYIHDEINENTMREYSYGLLDILNEDAEREKEEKNFKREPIKIFINSNGGKIDDCYSLINIMINSRKTPIYTYLTGYAYSSGFLIFIAGHKRFAARYSKVMLHSFSTGINDHSQNIIEFSDYCRKEFEMLKDYIMSRTEITEEMIEDIQIHKKDSYLFLDEILELKVADDVIRNL